MTLQLETGIAKRRAGIQKLLNLDHPDIENQKPLVGLNASTAGRRTCQSSALRQRPITRRWRHDDAARAGCRDGAGSAGV